MNVYIKLKTEFEEGETFEEMFMDVEDYQEAVLLGKIKPKEQKETWKGYEFVKVEGESCIQRFYEDAEGGITCCYGDDYIHYDITLKEFLERMKYKIEII